jgi:hypothetical protein
MRTKNISSNCTSCQNLDEASLCCGVFETTFGFDLPKGHIVAWLKDIGMLK